MYSVEVPSFRNREDGRDLFKELRDKDFRLLAVGMNWLA